MASSSVICARSSTARRRHPATPAAARARPAGGAVVGRQRPAPQEGPRARGGQGCHVLPGALRVAVPPAHWLEATLIGIDGADAIIKMVANSDIKIVPMRMLQKLVRVENGVVCA